MRSIESYIRATHKSVRVGVFICEEEPITIFGEALPNSFFPVYEKDTKEFLNDGDVDFDLDLNYVPDYSGI